MEGEIIDNFENPFDDVDKIFGNPFDLYSGVFSDRTITSNTLEDCTLTTAIDGNATIPDISDEFLNLDNFRNDNIGHNENQNNGNHVDELSSLPSNSYNRPLSISPTINNSSISSTSYYGQNNDEFSSSVSSLRSSPTSSTSTGLMESNINSNISNNKKRLYLLNADGTLSPIPMLSPPLSSSPSSSPSPPLSNSSNSIIYQNILLPNNQNDDSCAKSTKPQQQCNQDHIKLQNAATLPQLKNKNCNNMQLTLNTLQSNKELLIKKILLPSNKYKILSVKKSESMKNEQKRQNSLIKVIKPYVLKPKLVTAMNKKCHSSDKNFKSTLESNQIINSQTGDRNNNGNSINSINSNAIKNSLLGFQFLNDDAYKKQERLIRNRKSAMLSRKRKREYLCNLEHKVTELSKENTELKKENINLRNELTYVKQRCQCNLVNSQYSSSQEQLGQQHQLQQFKFNKSLKERFGIYSNMRKNATVLLAMVLMISFNVGGLLPTISQNKNQLELEKYSDHVGQLSLQRRSVLSSKLSSSDDAASLFDGHFGRSLLWTNEDDNLYNDIGKNKNNGKDDIKKNSTSSSSISLVGCSSFINQTENMRLTSELRKWIEINDMHQNITNDYENHDKGNTFIGPKSLLPSIVLSFNSKYLKKDYNNGHSNRYNSKITAKSGSIKENFQSGSNNATRSAKSPPKRYFHYHRHHQELKSNINNNKNRDYNNYKNHHRPQQPYNYHYLKLLKKIQRKDDTFYVLSFNSDHVLLPASEYNKTSRPKIALMFPAAALTGNKATLDINENDDKNGNKKNKMILMQIDCEVMNTTVLELNDYLTTNSNENQNNNYENMNNDKSNKRNDNKHVNVIKSNSIDTSSTPLNIAKKSIELNKNYKSILTSKFSDTNITAASTTNNTTTYSYTSNNNTRPKNLLPVSIDDHINNVDDFIIQNNQFNTYKPSSSVLIPPPFYLNKNPYYEKTTKTARVTNHNLIPLT